MKSIGNSQPNECANNLLRMVRGEVPFERIKGLDRRLVDKPLPSASAELEEDAAWLIGTYEPRVQFNGITISPDSAATGGFIVTANITEKEG